MPQFGDSYFDAEYPASVCTATTTRPTFSIAVDTLILARVDDLAGDFFYDANSFNFFDPNTYQPLGGLGNISDDVKPGFRVSIVDHDEDGTATELSFFQMEKFGDPYTVTSSQPITYVYYFTVPANPATSYDLDYSSRFRGIELNRKREFGSRFTGIAGIRYVQLSESFNINSSGGASSSKIDNELYGLQLGGDLKLFNLGRVQFGATVKGGSYLNHAHVSASVVRASSGQFARFVDNEDEIAFVGETMIGAFFPVGPKGNIRIGYQMYYLDGIGLSPDQSNTYSLFAQSGSIDTRDVWFHGGYVGLELFW
ncbi:MAG: hypothetical protein KDB27_19960 [Planctomycetales bacterium]|nr:hypothetical protein [Planctomycetales bacterium]